MSDLRNMFFEECDELLETLSSGLDRLQAGASDADTVNAMFRAVHSIKGGAGAFGLDGIVTFAHAMENVLDALRTGRVEAGDGVLKVLYRASDHICALVEAAREGTAPDPEAAARIVEDLMSVSRTGKAPDTGAGPDPGEGVEAAKFVPVAIDLAALADLEADSAEDTAGPKFRIRFRATRALYESGHDPALLFRSLDRLGTLDVTADTLSVAPLIATGACPATLSWTIGLTLRPPADEAAIREVFEFAEGLCSLEIEALDDAPETPPRNDAAGETPPVTPPAAAGDALVRTPDAEKPAPPPPPPAGEPRSATIRVELDRVDRLINLVGELVISEAMLRQSMSDLPRTENGPVMEAMGQLRQISGVLQESVMAIRAQPVRGLFQRMSRIVREAARAAGKDARFVVSGESTEIDKTVVERLVEPLTHMIRNAVDHGLETPGDRIEAGKPATGTIRLDAAHRSGRVVITLSDDGAGIDRARVRRTAEARGLVDPADDLTDGDIDALLFRPGFSTATEVSNLSGRGVGMDVVRSDIQALGGRVSIRSEAGAGTTLTISLPLTLAVMEGMVVAVEGEALIVPTVALRETFQPGQARIHPVFETDRVIAFDGELVPIVDLGAALGFRGAEAAGVERPLLLIESESGRKTALGVDRILDQREIVIKGLEQNYRAIPGIAAATILGDGKIALIIDIDHISDSRHAPRAAPPAPVAASERLHHA